MRVDPTLLLRLDASFRQGLQDYRNCFFDWSLVAVALVLLGVLLEGPEVIREVRKKASVVFPNVSNISLRLSMPEGR